MKDIDFDELDKAVTSLMGGIPTNDDTPRPDDGVKTLVIKTSQSIVSESPAATVSTTPAAPAAPAVEPEVAPAIEIPKRAAPMSSRPAPSLATRRGGRFMDVMHPSSDMAKTSPSSVSRNAGAIEPLNPSVTPEVHPVAEPAHIADVLPAETLTETASEWPDPLDLPQAQAQSPVADATERESPVVTTESALEEQIEPLTSPFLPDAKVEKRPLGGFAADPLDLSATESAPEAPAEPQSTPTSAPVEAVILPEELQGDLMAIESSQADTAAPALQSQPREAAQPVLGPQRPVAALRPQQTGPSSIPQQYKESPSTGDTTNGAIYDTDAYHQPLQHPVQKKPSWLWIVWIVGLLVVGAGGGALAYLFLLK